MTELWRSPSSRDRIPEGFFAIDQKHLLWIRLLARDLYRERTMNADAMRDHAHLLGLILDDACLLDPESLP